MSNINGNYFRCEVRVKNYQLHVIHKSVVNLIASARCVGTFQ